MDEIIVTLAEDVLVVEITEVVTLTPGGGFLPDTITCLVSAEDVIDGPIIIGNGRDDRRVVECSLSVEQSFDGDIVFSIGTNTEPFCLVEYDDSYPGIANDYIVDTNRPSSSIDLYRLFSSFTIQPTVGSLKITVRFDE